MDNDFAMGYAMGADSNGGNGNGGSNGMGFGGWGDLAALLVVAGLFGGGGWGFGGGGGFGGGAGAATLNGIATRADINEGFALQNITSGIQGIQQGICDSTYAVNNSLMSGFNGVDSAICNLGYNIQQGFNTLGYQQKDCCCETQRLIERGFCDLGNTMNSNTRDIIDNQNANFRSLYDFMVSEKLSAKDARIAELSNQLSQSQQNGVIRAAIDASTAEIIRRTGHDYPTASYLVQPPTPVNFPTNGCGQVQFGGGGCGCWGNAA